MKVMAIIFLALTASGSALLWISMRDKPQDDPNETTVAKGEFIFISGTEVDTLDPQAASWMTDFRAVELMFETPLTVNTETMELEPATCDMWEVSPDQLTYKIRIRKNAKWSNGDPVTSEDFIYAWQRALLPDYASQYFSLMLYIKGAREFFDLRNADKDAYLAAGLTVPAGPEEEVQKAKARLAARAKLDEQLAKYGGQKDQKNKATADALFKKTMADFESMVGVKAVNDRTITITLERPTPYFIELLAFATYAPVHKKSVAQTVTVNAETGLISSEAGYFTDPDRVITNGPYFLAFSKFKSEKLFKANPHYWDRGNMGNDAIRQLVIEDPNTAMVKYNNKEVHWLPDIPTSSTIASDLMEQSVKGTRKDVHLVPGAGTFFYHFNCKPEWEGQKNPFADWRVRRAFSMCIDRKLIVEKITRLHQPIAFTMTPVGAVPGYNPPVELGCSYDPAAARALLAEAGYPGGAGFPQDFKIFYDNTSPVAANIPQLIQQVWDRELGVRMTLEGVEKQRFMDLRRKTQFAVARGGWNGDYRDPTTFLEQHITDDGHNNSGYSNADFDRYYHAAAKELDQKKRYELLLEAEKILTREQPIAPIFQYSNFHVFDPDVVQNINPNLWGYRRLNEVTVKQKAK